ncbi:hypothetical protein RhiLY_10081 [Ceratobasidium sp. AG-Ba]|nr:hypothetical protein RhiLY_10081 [Ceratobasidium sp. AG-Ba]
MSSPPGLGEGVLRWGGDGIGGAGGRDGEEAGKVVRAATGNALLGGGADASSIALATNSTGFAYSSVYLAAGDWKRGDSEVEGVGSGLRGRARTIGLPFIDKAPEPVLIALSLEELPDKLAGFGGRQEKPRRQICPGNANPTGYTL